MIDSETPRKDAAAKSKLVANMAALKPYQNALLENRDVLLRDVRANDVCPLLYVSGVLTQKEIDDINIGRTAQERTESLLDLLHYKGPNGFQELCVALEDTHPHLAAKLRAKNPQVEVLGKPLFSWILLREFKVLRHGCKSTAFVYKLDLGARA